MKEPFAGKKVYLLGVAAVVYAVVSVVTGTMEIDQAIDWTWNGGLAMAFRAALAKMA